MNPRRARLGAAMAAAGIGAALLAGGGGTAAADSASHPHIDCTNTARSLCFEVNDSDKVFGWYVGHDEPSLLFYSNTPGSGNQMEYSGVLPKEPPRDDDPGRSNYTFEYAAAFWFGMVMCDTESYPELVNSCVPDSNVNIVDPAKSPYHPGAAYMELQFYPPGYVQQWNGFSCSATQWCVALTIDSLSINALTGQSLNPTCAAKTGLEYVNFAYLTASGKPQGPPNPIQFDPIASGTPNPAKGVLYLNQGDSFNVNLHDTAHGLEAAVNDVTTGKSGYMIASAANGFGQVKFAPTGTSCTLIPYDFHPMYSTSTTQTTDPWAAATYNVAIDTEVGHFDYCAGTVNTTTTACTGQEGAGSNKEPADADDSGCFPPSASGYILIAGCEGANLGYDGTSYLNDWPNGAANRPTDMVFTSPLTGSAYDVNYSQVGFNTDLPAIESGYLGTCSASTGAGCTIIPPTDDNNAPAQFYPYYSTGQALGGCAWTIGQDYPGFSTNDFGKNAQYGKLLKVAYTSGSNGEASYQYNDYQNILSNNPCPR